MRLEHTSRALERSRECQGLSSLLTLQHEWLMDVARDYIELNKRFSDVVQEIAVQPAANASEVMAEAARKAKATSERVAAE
jgi:hypothetical protein